MKPDRFAASGWVAVVVFDAPKDLLYSLKVSDGMIGDGPLNPADSLLIDLPVPYTVHSPARHRTH